MRDSLKLADDFLQKGEYLKAIEFANKYLETNPDSSRAYETLGIAKYRLRDINSSLESLEKAIALDPKNSNAQYNLSVIFISQSEWHKALGCIDVALSVNNLNCDYLYNKAYILSSLDQIENALSLCNQVLNLSPSHSSSLFLRANLFLKSKQYLLAIEDYKKLDFKATKKAIIYNNIGFCYSKIGDIYRAKINLQFALEWNPSEPYALNNLGFIYYLEKNYERALKLINESLSIDSTNSYAFKNRALVLIELDQKNQAIEDLECAKELGYSKMYDNEVDLLLEENKKISG